MTLFCLAAVVFPIGFHIAAIGGRPYKLPHHTQVGSAYVLFIMAIFFTVISELFSSRVCLPVLWWCSISVCCKSPQSSSLHCHCHLRTVVLSSVCQFCDGVSLVVFLFCFWWGGGGAILVFFITRKHRALFFPHSSWNCSPVCTSHCLSHQSRVTDLRWCSVSVYCRQAQHHFLHHSLRVVLQSCVSTSSVSTVMFH